MDGNRRPIDHDPAPIVGTQDDSADYGATFDALNIWELSIKWSAHPTASLILAAQLPTAPFDSIFPCVGIPGVSRDCLPEPGIVNPAQYLDILSYRQRPTWRLAYRNFGKYESLVTNQSVEATTGLAGARWYEIRRTGGTYSIYQQGTYAPGDGVHRWMGSIAQDKKGNMALGYSVVNGVDVFPGIRYTGRLAGDPLGMMTLGEATIINGSGVQTTLNSRWGDYTSMNIDPSDDCTFWYGTNTTRWPAKGRPRRAGKRVLVASSCLAATSGSRTAGLERTTVLPKMFGIVLSGRSQIFCRRDFSSAIPLLIDGAYRRLPLIPAFNRRCDWNPTLNDGNCPSSET